MSRLQMGCRYNHAPRQVGRFLNASRTGVQRRRAPSARAWLQPDDPRRSFVSDLLHRLGTKSHASWRPVDIYERWVSVKPDAEAGVGSLVVVSLGTAIEGRDPTSDQIAG